MRGGWDLEGGSFADSVNGQHESCLQLAAQLRLGWRTWLRQIGGHSLVAFHLVIRPIEDYQARILRPSPAMWLLYHGIFSLGLRSSGSITGTVAGKNFDGGLDLLRTSREGQLAKRHSRPAFHFPISHESLCRRTTRSILWGVSLERGAGA